MNDFLRLLSFGSGAFCIGAGLAILLIFAIAARQSSGSNDGEGCLGGFVALVSLFVAIGFFYLAIQGW
jgi:hypothetical protein